MDNINDDFENYYNLTVHQQHHQQQQQQYNNQNQPIRQQHTNHQQGHIIPPHTDPMNPQHHHLVNDTFDQHAMLNYVSNDFYTSGHFNNSVNSSSNIFISSQCKPYTDSQAEFLDGINRGIIPHQADRSKSLSSIPTYPPGFQSFPDSLNINQLPQRRNSDMVFYHDNNGHGDNIDPSSSNYVLSGQQQQEQVLLQQDNAMSTLGHPQNSLATSSTRSNFQPKPRQEQDVFGELISMATKNNAIGQSWQIHNNPSSNQYLPFSFPSNDIQHQLQSQQLLHRHQQNVDKYPNSTNSPSSTLIPTSDTAKVLTASSKVYKKASSTLHSKDNIAYHDERIYELSIAQQPSRARMCGFGDKDRRPISPPPIVKLTVRTKSGQLINPETFDTSFLIIMCDSCQQTDPIEGDFNASIFENPLSQVISYPTNTNNEDGTASNTAIKMRNLVGSSVSSASKLYDLDGKLGIFFVFQDISLRTEGCFRLKFSLVDVGMPYSHNVNTTTVSHVLKVIYTDPFVVYTAKKFPGVVQSTQLSKCFARQGIKIPIRKEKNASLKKKHDDETSESFNQYDDEDFQDDKD